MKRFGAGWTQYGRNTLYGADCLIHVRRVESEPTLKGEHTAHFLTEKQEREIEICLHCTRKECTGGEGCFKHIRENRSGIE